MKRRRTWAAGSALVLAALIVAWWTVRPDVDYDVLSLEALRERCATGDAAACLPAAARLDPTDPAAPRDLPALLARGCEGEQWAACGRLGWLHLRGDGVQRDESEAARLLGLACDHGEDAACLNLGIMTVRGEGVVADPARAVQLFGRACELGSGDACARQALTLPEGPDGPNAEARALLDRGCSGGSALGCWLLGMLYIDDQSAEADPARAADYFKQGCASDGMNMQRESCLWFGILNHVGRGVHQDQQRAAELYSRLCPASVEAVVAAQEEGDSTTTDACALLSSIMFDDDEGYDARQMLETGCDNGSTPMCFVAANLSTGSPSGPSAEAPTDAHGRHRPPVQPAMQFTTRTTGPAFLCPQRDDVGAFMAEVSEARLSGNSPPADMREAARAVACQVLPGATEIRYGECLDGKCPACIDETCGWTSAVLLQAELDALVGRTAGTGR